MHLFRRIGWDTTHDVEHPAAGPRGLGPLIEVRPWTGVPALVLGGVVGSATGLGWLLTAVIAGVAWFAGFAVLANTRRKDFERKDLAPLMARIGAEGTTGS